VSRERRDPGPGEHDRCGEGHVAGGVAGSDRDAGEAGEEQHPGDAGERRPALAAIGRERAGGDEAGRDQADEPDPARDEVQHAVPADVGSAVRRSGRKAEGRIRAEHAGADQAYPVRPD